MHPLMFHVERWRGLATAEYANDLIVKSATATPGLYAGAQYLYHQKISGEAGTQQLSRI